MIKATLELQEDALLELTIKGEPFLIPLAQMMTPAEVEAVRDEKEAKAFLGKFIPERVTSTFKTGDWNNVARLWKAATDKYEETQKDLKLGES